MIAGRYHAGRTKHIGGTVRESGQAAAGAVAPRQNNIFYAHYVLGVLCIANILAGLDRSVMSLLLQPIKQELQASDTEMSILTGASFIIFYSLFGLYIARLADRGNRRSILAGAVVVWSAMTGLCGMATNFLFMAVARAGVGIGESAGTPTTMSLIADYYKRELRTQAVSIFHIAVPLGGIFLTPLLGVIADTYGWRAAFYVLAVPGIFVALLLQFTVKEPIRGALDGAPTQSGAQPTFGQTIGIMWSSRPFRLIMIGNAIVGLGVGTLAAWGPAVMMRAFNLSATMVASVASPLFALGSLAGTAVGGFAIGYFVKRFKDYRWTILLPAIASIATVPAGLLFGYAPTWQLTVFGGVLGTFSVGMRTAPYLALVLDLVPSNCRGMAAAATVVANSVIGMAGGPLIVGVISDILAPSMGSVAALRTAFLFAPVTLAVGLVPYFMALRDFDRAGQKPSAA